MGLTLPQLCALYLDGNDEAAFQVFEHGGPRGLREFLGFKGSEHQWKQLYCTILDDYCFLDRLCEKYAEYTGRLIQDRGVNTFREVFGISESIFDPVVTRVLTHELDGMFGAYMNGVFLNRKKSHIGMFFTGLRGLLRRELGF